MKKKLANRLLEWISRERENRFGQAEVWSEIKKTYHGEIFKNLENHAQCKLLQIEDDLFCLWQLRELIEKNEN